MDLDMLVAEADPARHADLPGPDSAEAARLYRQITAPAARRSRMRPPGAVAAAGLVAAAAAAALLLMNFTGSPGPGSPGQGSAGQGSTGQGSTGPGSVVAILDTAAVAAGHGAGASHPPGPGQYLYVQEIDAKGLSNQPSRRCAFAPMRVRAWVAADGSGRQAGTFPARCPAGELRSSPTAGGVAALVVCNGAGPGGRVSDQAEGAGEGDREAVRARALPAQRHLRLRSHVPQRRV